MAAIDIRLLGDMILDTPDPDHWLSGIAPLMHDADLCIAHLEVPHTRRGLEVPGDVPAPGAEPDHLAALSRAGVHAVSLAGNHMMDRGPEGLADTIGELDRLGIAHSGAGADLVEARRPVLIRRAKRTIALLSYNCVGPEFSWATQDRAGCAYVRVRALDGGPPRPQADLVEAEPQSVEEMASDIHASRAIADFVIVALHKGITHRPAALAPYERPLAHAAVDAGADIVVGHHAHIARGIEFHRGKPIFHGLGNGVVVTRALSPGQDHPARAAWVEKRRTMFGFEPDPAYELAPFHPEAVNGMIARVVWDDDGTLSAGFMPIWSEPPGRPVPAGDRAAAISDYIDEIGVREGLKPLDRQSATDWVALEAPQQEYQP
ncbi:MAG: CapA family protein [Sphingomicrobium sp.]